MWDLIEKVREKEIRKEKWKQRIWGSSIFRLYYVIIL